MSKATDAVLTREALLAADSRRPVFAGAAAAVRSGLTLCCRRELVLLNLLAFLLGRIVVLGELMPFGLALFLAVAVKQRTLAATVGLSTLAGSLSLGFGAETACYLGAMLVYLRLTAVDKPQQPRWAVPALLAAAGALGGITLLLWQMISLYQLLLLLFTIAVVAPLKAVFAAALPLLLPSQQQESDEQAVCLAVLLAAAIAGIGQAQLFGYGLRNMLSGFLIMTLTLRGGPGIGISAGTAIGLVSGLNSGNAAAGVAYYALASLLGGIFAAWGKAAIALGYITGCMLSVAYLTANDQITTVLGETVAASAVFLAVPVTWSFGWRKKPVPSEAVPAQELAVSAALLKLSRVSELFGDLADAFGGETTASEPADIRQIVDRLGEQVCKDCGQRQACWETRFYNTYQGFIELLSAAPDAKRGGLPPALRECRNRQALLTAAGEIIDRNQAGLCWRQRVAEQRAMLVEQMRSAAGIIDALASDIRQSSFRQHQAELCLAAAAAAAGSELESVEFAGQGAGLRVSGRKQPCSGDQACQNTLLPLVCGELGRRLTVSGKCGSRALQRKCRLVFCASPRYTIDVGAASLSKDPQVCGDTCAVTEAGQGRIAAMISDGMGSGSAAARESQAAIRILEKLLAADFSITAAAKSVNAMLLLRTPGECYATVDVMVFDLLNGEAEFLKTGSAVSYIKRVREVSVVQSSSLPVGIVEQVEVEPQRRRLAAGDTVVMVSDGIAEADRQRPRRDWVANFLRMAPDDDPQQLAGLIIAQAQKLAGAAVRDDMTVLVLKVRELPV
ncbi:MAG: SpoIIE family protein phosphatase [Sporomusaceae bacterium]|nr:SpoIIE family protein phosphatase [Sporomusaceae bacterium]